MILRATKQCQNWLLRSWKLKKSFDRWRVLTNKNVEWNVIVWKLPGGRQSRVLQMLPGRPLFQWNVVQRRIRWKLVCMSHPWMNRTRMRMIQRLYTYETIQLRMTQKNYFILLIPTRYIYFSIPYHLGTP